MSSLLPIDSVLPELLTSCSTNDCVILHAPPGAGKTTRVPLALLDLIPPQTGRVIMLEPRRLAAVSAARYMAASLGEEVGVTVGYSIRFESKLSPATRIEVVTEGVLTRRVQNDPLLDGVAMVIFDEFHERSIQADLGLALCRYVQQQVRPDLKLLVMSATLDSGPLSRMLGDAPVVSAPGRQWPVSEHWLDDHTARLPERVYGAVRRALAEQEGDILVFLPGAGEIRVCASRLADAAQDLPAVDVHQLFGDLPFERQQAAIRPGPRRKIILATNIAETSLTIDGVRVVIDCGLSRRVRHDQASGMNRLVTVRESAASAEQRKGRAGRQGPGACYRLFSRHTRDAMTPFTPPELLEADLAPLLLELAAWGSGDAGTLAWLDPPPPASLGVARNVLQRLGALDSNGAITERGRRMAQMPLHPRLASLLLRAEACGCFKMGCDLAALLSERDIFRRGMAAERAPRLADSDMTDRLECLQLWRERGICDSRCDTSALASVERVSRQLMRIQHTPSAGCVSDSDTLARLLLAAYPDRIARRREEGSERCLLLNGRGARMSPYSAVQKAIWLLAVDVDGQGEAVIHRASAVTPELIRQECLSQLEQVCEAVWDSREGRVVSVREERIGLLALSSAQVVAESDVAIPVVLGAVRESRLSLLSFGDDSRQLRNRVAVLRSAMPEEEWPDLSDEALMETLEEWLAPHLTGVTTARGLAALDMSSILRGMFSYRDLRRIDEQAPTHLEVPSGSRIRLEYGDDGVPVLAVKLQELFGLAETPGIAGGRVNVLLHLLSPAGRPLQVTRDLKGFWDGSYHEVKKEMKGRYPKHPWPDDPWSCPATRKTKNQLGK